MAKIKLTPQEEELLHNLCRVNINTKSEIIMMLNNQKAKFDYEIKPKWFESAEAYEMAVKVHIQRLTTIQHLINKIGAMNNVTFKKATK